MKAYGVDKTSISLFKITSVYIKEGIWRSKDFLNRGLEFVLITNPKRSLTFRPTKSNFEV